MGLHPKPSSWPISPFQVRHGSASIRCATEQESSKTITSDGTDPSVCVPIARRQPSPASSGSQATVNAGHSSAQLIKRS